MNNSGNLEDQDPDYAVPGPSTSYQQKIYEETARTNASRKITSVIDREFSVEIDAKEREILQIQEKLDKALKTLHFLRYVIISDFYNRKQCLTIPSDPSQQTRLHPAVRSSTGKSPKYQNLPSTSHHSTPPSTLVKDPLELSVPFISPGNSFQNSLVSKNPENPETPQNPDLQNLPRRSPNKTNTPLEPPRKIPRYIPPKISDPAPKIPSRGVRHKIRKRIVVGNISKWIPPDWREDEASHKWTMYVRTSKEESDISEFVAKVRFFLHPSYRPNDVVDVTSPPFHLCRRGWGEFPLRVQLHFKNQNNKPMDIIHHLKLDRTYTGLQTLGSETVVDIWINTLNCDLSDNKITTSDRQITNSDRFPTVIKQEIDLDIEDSGISERSRVKKENTDDDDIEVLSHIHFEHDYANFGRPEEGHVTIAHSPSEKEVNCNISLQNGNSSEPPETPDVHTPKIIQNGGSPKKNDNSILISNVQTLPKIFNNGSSILQPLKITIPSHFESLKSQRNPDNPSAKKILLRKNNEKITKLDEHGSQQIVSLLKNPKKIFNLKLDPSKSVILNSSSNIPILKIAEPDMKPPEPPNYGDKPNGKYSKTKRTIGKDKTKLGFRKEFYAGILRELEEVRISSDMQGIMSYIMKRIPLVSPYSHDVEYRRLHPYACMSTEEFLEFNPGKQRALEWYRAKQVHGLLKKRGVSEDDMWTVKEIMLWCRLHGYTPVGNSGVAGGVKSEKLIEVSGGEGDEEFNTCTEPGEFLEWMQGCKEVSEDYQEDEVEVDVVGAETVKVGEKGVGEESGREMVTMEVPKSAEPMYSYVCNTVRQYGVKLVEEEVVEGVRHGAAGRLLAKTAECLLEDLLRSSLAQAFERCGHGSCPDTITPEDVRAAIFNREQFDIFTDNGLGTQNSE